MSQTNKTKIKEIIHVKDIYHNGILFRPPSLSQVGNKLRFCKYVIDGEVIVGEEIPDALLKVWIENGLIAVKYLPAYDYQTNVFMHIEHLDEYLNKIKYPFEIITGPHPFKEDGESKYLITIKVIYER